MSHVLWSIHLHLTLDVVCLNPLHLQQHIPPYMHAVLAVPTPSHLHVLLQLLNGRVHRCSGCRANRPGQQHKGKGSNANAVRMRISKAHVT